MKKLITELNTHNISLSVDKDELVVDFQGDDLSEELILKIKENKTDLIQYLHKYAGHVNYTEVPKVELKESYEISSGQKRLWVLSQFEESASAYNIPAIYVLDKHIDINNFRKAINATIERHEILRTIFKENTQGEVRQWILKSEDFDFQIDYKDLRNAENKDEKVQAYLAEDLEKVFDLENGPLFRTSLIQTDEAHYVFYLNMHHIISDGWSKGVLSKDVLTYYEAFSEGKVPPIDRLRIQYKDYSAWQLAELEKEGFKNHRAYWFDSLSGELPLLDLSGAKQRPKVKTNNGHKFGIYLDAKLTIGLKEYSEENGGSLFMSLLAGWNILMYHYTAQKDIITGTAIAGRGHADLEDQIGFYVNTLALRNEVNPAESFNAFYKTVRDNTLKGFSHQMYPFDELVEELRLERDTTRNPIFDAFILLLNTEINTEKFDLNTTQLNQVSDLGLAASKFDLEVSFYEKGDYLSMELVYNSDIYEADTIKSLIRHYRQLLNALLKQPNEKIGQIGYLSQEEKQELLISFNSTAAEFNIEKTIVELFEEQVIKTPNNIAVVFKEDKLTYQELNIASNQLAHYLQKKVRIGQDDIVGIKLNRTVDYVIAILATLKSSGCCSPINPDLPADRFTEISKHFKTIIDQATFKEFQNNKGDCAHTNPEKLAKSSNLAYVLFTSGSAGIQKPCMLEHKGIVNHLFNKIQDLNLTKESDLVHASKMYFVGSIWQLWAPLIVGAKVNIPTVDQIQDISELLALVNDKGVKILEVIPSQIANLIALNNQVELEGIEQLILTGEPLKRNLIEKILELSPTIELTSTYGMTECSDVIASYSIRANQKWDHRIIGRPIKNLQIYVLDENQLLCPVGVNGEIYISGHGVSRGYLKQEELTNERFLDNPFNEGERLYKTGDLGRWTNKGEVTFIGRIDNQVHIRGFRIELGEIEFVLLKNEVIKEAIVIAKENENEEKELIAYFTSNEEQVANNLREYLKEMLPDYMLPAYFVQLDKLPLTKNGKVDRKYLPDPKGLGLSSGAAYEAPQNEMEEKLVTIWTTVLQRENIGVKDDFFGLGGHSLKAVRLANYYQKEFEVKLTLKDLFTHTTIASHCELIQFSAKEKYSQIRALTAKVVEVATKSGFPVSDAQRRLWVLSQFEDGSIAYNSPGNIYLEEEVNRDLLQKAINATIQRHEILRTTFKQNESGELKQWINPAIDLKFKIDYVDFSEQKANEIDRLLHAYMKEDSYQPFDLKNGPLVRASLIKVKGTGYVFYYNMHHIISDGWSTEVLSKDVFTYYKAFKENKTDNILVDLRIQYKDYTVWQLEQLEAESTGEHRDFWMEHFSGNLPVLDLPSSKFRPKIKTHNGVTLGTFINSGTTAKLKKYSDQNGGSLFIGLLSAWNVLMYRYTAQKDIIIGTPIAGREHRDLENQIGCYVNTLALRNEVKSTDNFDQLFSRIKETTLNAFTHQSYSFDRLVEELKLQRDRSRSAVFDISMTYHNVVEVNETHAVDSDLIDTISNHGLSPVKNDMELHFQEIGDCLAFKLKYNTDVYDHEMVERLMEHFKLLLTRLLESPKKSIAQTDFLRKKEKYDLLVTFNDTAFDYPKNKTLTDLFEAQVKRTPDHFAITYGDKKWTYKELDELSNQLAACLEENHSVESNQLVGIQFDRSEEMLVSILAVLKLGAAYIPIDPEYPIARKEYIVNDSALKLLITNTSFIYDIDYYDGETLAYDVEFDFGNYSGAKVERNTSANDLAYVIYTSGSTGTPKGVLVEHRAIVNTVLSQIDFLKVDDTSKGLQFASFSFDASIWETFIILLSGGCLSMVSEQQRKEPKLLVDFINTAGIDIATLPPSFLNRIEIKSLKGLKKLITAGESAVSAKASEFLEFGSYYNAFGPTETSICCTIFKLEKEALISSNTLPIGKPIANAQIHILSEENELQPIGVIGEICVGGIGLAKGYLNRADLTQEKFIKHPFEKGALLYKTGDLGKWLPDGNIKFIGRIDDQVKIRGHRVELGELEQALLKNEEIQEAVVIVRENEVDVTSEKELIAYITSDIEQKSDQIRHFLAQSLPGYMLPNHYVQLESFPQTTSGKVDKKALPNPTGLVLTTSVEYIGPRNEDEENIIELWGSILATGKERISVKDGFFELGGDSISALRLITGLRKEMDYQLSVADIYNHDSVESLAQYITENKAEIGQKNQEQQKLTENMLAAYETLKENVLSADKLDRQNVEDLYPMSDIEKGMVFGYLMNEGTATYHDQILFERQFHAFNPQQLEQALALMIEKHAILRTSFNLQDYETEIQIVHKNIIPKLHFEDLSHLNRANQEVTIKSYLKSELDERFEVNIAPLWRMSAFQVSKDNYLFVFQCLHAIIDGWSDASLMTELNNIYLKLGEDKNYKPALLNSTYKDFVIQNQISRTDIAVQNFWKNELLGYERLDLFTEQVALDKYVQKNDSDYLKEVENVANQLNTSVKGVALSAYLYMLKILNYNTEIVTGLVTNIRPNTEDGDKILGCFLNTIPLKMEVDGSLKCTALIAEVHKKLIELKNNERLSLLAITDICEEKSEVSNPFFDVLFNYVDFHVFQDVEEDNLKEEDNSENVKINVDGHGRTNTFFDFIISTTGGHFSLDLSATRKLKSDLSLAYVGKLYFRILDFILADFTKQLQDTDYLSTSEKEDLLVTLNGIETTYPKQKTIVDLFEEQVGKSLNKTAVFYPRSLELVDVDSELTYQELNEQSNQFAHYLQDNYTIQPNDLIGIKLDRSEWMLISILGVLKSGGAYVPIDPETPQERVDFIEKDTNCKVCIDAAELTKFKANQSAYATGNVVADIKTDNLAYVIYTSGSTGKPKGVLVDHHNVVRLFKTEDSLFDFSEKDVWTMFHSYAFDFSVWEMFGALLFGGKLVVIPKLVAQDSSAYLKLIETEGVTVLNQTPSAFYNLSKEAENSNMNLTARYVIFGGEALSPNRLSNWNKRYPNCKLINMYGITEGTVHTTYKKISEEDIKLNRSNIGKPIPTVKCIALDQHMNLVPLGVEGELYIGGEGVAQGYLNREELTKERFVANPYVKGERFYRTGDKVKQLANGDFEYLGRIDDQVKIRGYRIELGEIEHALLKYELIEEAVVLVKTNADGDKNLVAFITAHEEQNSGDLRHFLKDSLPEYMQPAYYVQLAEMPLTSNGKVDKKALPNPEGLGIKTGVEYVAPRNEVEEKLVKIWEEVLQKENIGIKEDFFTLGGNSIKAMKIIAAIQTEFGHKIEVRKIFVGPTIENISLDIENTLWIKGNMGGNAAKKIII